MIEALSSVAYTSESWPADRWPNFSFTEMKCRCGCGQARLVPIFMDRLQELRERCGFGLPVTSGYRCPTHNKNIGGGRAHPAGLAADIQIARSRAHIMLGHALDLDFRGVGLKQKGANRFIHLDILPSHKRTPRPTIWTY